VAAEAEEEDRIKIGGREIWKSADSY